MKHLLLSVLMLFGVVLGVSGQTSGVPDYQIEGAGTGSQGTYLIKVTMVSKNKKPQDSDLIKCAVHGVLFRGFANKELRQSQKPLAGSPTVEAQQAEFFEQFFTNGGQYTNYGQTVDSSRTVIKAGKQYKVSATVTVGKEQLLKDLEAAGIIKSLNSIF